MSRLSKTAQKAHKKALDLLDKDVLSDDEKEFVFNNYQESAQHLNTDAGAFFTPLDLAWDTVIEADMQSRDGAAVRYLDLCSGIGVFAYTLTRRYPMSEVHCVEINPDYVAAGKKLVPEATWHCFDITDPRRMHELGVFAMCVSNPPYGRSVGTLNGKIPGRYSGAEAEYKAIEIAGNVSRNGVFLIPQCSSGFRYSGVQCFQRYEQDKYRSFVEQTGLELEVGIGIDTSVYLNAWKGVKPSVEIVNVDYSNRLPIGGQPELF